MSTRTLVTLFAIPLLVLAAAAAKRATGARRRPPIRPSRTNNSSPRIRTARWWPTRASASASSPRKRIGATRRRLDTREAYQQFLAQYPAGKWAREAQIRIDNFALGGASRSPATGPRHATCRRAQRAQRAAARRRHRRPVPRARGFGVQLGAFSSAERANAEWNKLKAEAAGTLDGLEPRVVVGEVRGQDHLSSAGRSARRSAGARRSAAACKVANKPCVPVLAAPLTHLQNDGTFVRSAHGHVTY